MTVRAAATATKAAGTKDVTITVAKATQKIKISAAATALYKSATKTVKVVVK